MKIVIKKTGKWKEARRLFFESSKRGERTKKFGVYFGRRVCKSLVDLARRKLPSSLRKDFEDSIKIYDVWKFMYMNEWIPAFIIRAEDVEKDVSGENWALYVEPKEGMKLTSIDVVIRKYEPWLSGSLPVEPSDNVILRGVQLRPDEVVRLKEKLESKADDIIKDFGAVGVPVNKERMINRGYPTRRIVYNPGFDFLRIEFGFGGRRVKHWRPAFYELVKRLIPNFFMTDRMISKTLLHPSFLGWRSVRVSPDRLPPIELEKRDILVGQLLVPEGITDSLPPR